MSVALFTKHAKFVHYIILSFVACLDLPYFSTLSHKGTIFGKKLMNIKCVYGFSLQLLSETLLSVKEIQQDIITNVHRSSCKAPIILVRF